jgi:hypothetical protein
MKTVVALYANGTKAADAAEALIESGFPADDVGVVARGTGNEFASMVTDPAVEELAERQTTGDGIDEAEGAGIGALLGGAAGLLAGLAALTIPGLGPIIAAGPLVTALVGAGVGAAAGGVIGALTDAGIHDEDARQYAEAIRRGSAIVAVRANDKAADRAAGILHRFAPIDLEEAAGPVSQGEWEAVNEAEEAADRPYYASDPSVLATEADAPRKAPPEMSEEDGPSPFMRTGVDIPAALQAEPEPRLAGLPDELQDRYDDPREIKTGADRKGVRIYGVDPGASR